MMALTRLLTDDTEARIWSPAKGGQHWMLPIRKCVTSKTIVAGAAAKHWSRTRKRRYCVHMQRRNMHPPSQPSSCGFDATI